MSTASAGNGKPKKKEKEPKMDCKYKLLNNNEIINQPQISNPNKPIKV